MNYQDSKAWPYVEARRIAQRNITGRDVVFSTGFGSSGLPHLGTFAEVARTTMVRRAYEDLMGLGRNQGTRLIVFADDLDALRKVPDNISHREAMEPYLGYAVSSIPDFTQRHESFAHAHNWMLRDFLDRFGFDYEFMSATDTYRSGRFDAALSVMWDRYDAVRNIILPTVGEERRATYSPFMPILPDGQVIMEGVAPLHQPNTLIYSDRIANSSGGLQDHACITGIHGGRVKCQWKADWALRWYALGVDYEMAGKDLIDSVTLSSKIVRAIGGRPPVNMIYEMFLDEHGHKISKSKGNGLTMDQWLRYGTADSLSAYLYREPQRAKKLYPAVVIQAMDDYNDARAKYPQQTPDQQLGNPLHHVHGGRVPEGSLPFSYNLMLNIAETAAVDSKARLHQYACRAIKPMSDRLEDDLGNLISGVFNYYEDFLKGNLVRRPATSEERKAIRDLADRINGVIAAHAVEGIDLPEEAIQFEVYEVGKAHFGKERLRDWFRTLYETVLGKDSGPRFGAFATLYGPQKTVALLREIIREAE